MKEENVLKRQVGLQQFLDGICSQSLFLQTDLARSFLNLSKRDNPSYLIPDHVYSSIFRFLTLRDIFPHLLYVTKWWKTIIYNSFQNMHIAHVEDNLFFGHTPINVDVIPEFVQFISLFPRITNLNMSRINELEDVHLEMILTNCPLLENIIINNCNDLIYPKIKLNQEAGFVTSLSLPYCVSLQGIHWRNTMHERLGKLDLTGTELGDEQLEKLQLNQFQFLQELNLSSMKNLKKPIVKNDFIKVISFRHCTNLTDIALDLPQLKELNLGRTQLSDDTLRIGVIETYSSVNLMKIWLDQCDHLVHVNLSKQSIQVDKYSIDILHQLAYLNVQACKRLEQVLTDQQVTIKSSLSYKLNI
jgi:hypothetical protein